VRRTGGLADTVHDFTANPECGNGFVFEEYSVEELQKTIGRALRLYWDHPDTWRNLVQRIMEADYSWSKSAASYVELYQRAIAKNLAYETITV
jgi:starch synthase